METDKTNLNAVLYALGELKTYKTLSNSERNVAIEAMNNLNSTGIDLGFVFTDVKNNDIILPKTDIDELIREVFERLEEYEDSDSYSDSSSNGSNSFNKSSSNKSSSNKSSSKEEAELEAELEDEEAEVEDEEDAEEELHTSSLSEQADSDEDDSEDEDRVPKVHTENFAIYVRSHGKNTLNENRLFEEFISPIDVTKITACGLCDIVMSYDEYDYFIPLFMNELDKDYKQQHSGDTIFNHPRLVIEVTRYLICKIHPELACRLGARTIDKYDDILRRKTYLYPELISGNVKFRKNVPFDTIIKSLTQIEGTCPTNMYKHTARHNVGRKQRNKIYEIDKGETSLDIICLTPYYNQPFNIKLKRGDSLLQFFYKFRKRYKALVDRMIREFDGQGPAKLDEHNFKPTMMWSKYKKYPNKNISSISLKFILFFFQKLGIRNMTVVDFSCGVVESNKDKIRKQGWTDSSSASSRSAKSSLMSSNSSLDQPNIVLKDAGVEEARGKSKRRRRGQSKKRQSKKRKSKKRKSKKSKRNKKI
jgi:hypothetical protein